MANVLLTYELVPDETIVALIPEVSEAWLAQLKSVHNTFDNSTSITKKQSVVHDVINKNLGKKGSWHAFITKGPIEVPPDTTFVRCGFIL